MTFGNRDRRCKLVYNEKECGWYCSNCSALYSDDEVNRMFGYTGIFKPEKFEGGYCMDCGTWFMEAECADD